MTNDFVRARISRLQRLLTEHRLDAYISVKLVNTYYLSGFTSLDTSRPTSYVRPVVVVITPSTDTLIIPELDAEPADATSAIRDIRSYSSAPPAAAARAATVEALEAASATRIGIEEDAMTAEWVDHLRNCLPEAELVFAGDLVARLRLQKDQLELGFLRKAAELSDLAMQASLSSGRRGETELAAETHGIIALRSGAASDGDGAFVDAASLILSGPRGSMPHEFTTGRVIQHDDLSWHCWLVSYRGYWVENVRTSVAGTSREYDRAFDILYESLLAGQEKARPGVTAGDVYREVMRVLRGNPVPGGVILTRSGHGVGLEYHEPPFLEDSDTTVLEPNVVFTVEPGIWIPGKGGLTLSNTLVINETGNEVITRASEALFRAA